MTIRKFRPLAFAFALLAGSAALLSAAEPARRRPHCRRSSSPRSKKSDYESFVAEGDASFRQMKPEKFAGAAAHFAPKFRAGYEVTYLGDLKQSDRSCHAVENQFPRPKR